jgi:hypothetical protein
MELNYSIGNHISYVSSVMTLCILTVWYGNIINYYIVFLNGISDKSITWSSF